MTEIWKIIEEYPDYEVSNMGNVRSNKLGKTKLLKQQCTRLGYYRVYLFNGKLEKWKRVNILVLEAFVGKAMLGMESSHLDNNSKNNKLSNLKWESVAENNRRNPNVKLSMLKASWIRKLKDIGFTSNRLAKEFGICRGHVNSINRLENWQ